METRNFINNIIYKNIISNILQRIRKKALFCNLAISSVTRNSVTEYE